MYLLIDCGNTKDKVAFVNGTEVVKSFVYDSLSVGDLKKVLNNVEINKSIYCSVKNNKNINDYLNKKFNNIELTYKTKTKIKNNYYSKKTLGADRIALVSGAKEIYPDFNVLVIDLGSCITYDYVNSKYEYFGGMISPGYDLRLKSLKDKTSIVFSNKEFKSIDLDIISKNSEQCVYSGVYFGILNEIQGIVDLYNQKINKFKIILTGGNYSYFGDHLKFSHIFDENLIFKGLTSILKTNEI